VSDDGAIVVTTNLGKQFGTVTALKSATLRVQRGQSLALFGRNGAGKTTFLKIIATLIRSYRGEAQVFGRDLKSADSDLRRRIGFLSHEHALYPDLTATDNLIFYARLYGLPDPQQTAATMITDVGLDVKRHTAVRALSRGMKQRLALGRAFLHRPELLLLDEPFTGLDEIASALLARKLDAFRDDGGTAIIVEHNVHRVWSHADRIAVLDRGGVSFEASVKDTNVDSFTEAYRNMMAT